MIKFIVFLFLCFGICTILIDSIGPWHCFEKWHNWMYKHTPVLEELFSCYICLPTWCGMVLSLIDYFILTGSTITPFNAMLDGSDYWYLIMAFDGAVASGGVFLIHTIQVYLEKIVEDE